MRYTLFTNGQLCDNGKLYSGDLYIDNHTGKIVRQPVEQSEIEIVNLKGLILAPGYIDIQNNGVYGINFSSVGGDATQEDIAAFRRDYRDALGKYVKTGVTSLCPTMTSSFPSVYRNMLPVFKRNRGSDGTDSLGAHIEGPFINLLKKGCHPVETFVNAEEGYSKLDQVYGEKNLTENVCILTAAPETPGMMDVFPILKEKNITCSIGHTAADYQTALTSVDRGVTMITHLYNAMTQPHHRDAGVYGLIASPIPDNTPYYGLICDGIHVDPSMVVIAYRNNPDKCMLVTDAMHLIGLPDGLYKWDSQSIEKIGPKLYLEGTNTLAGAATTLPQCVRNLMSWSHITLPEAVKTVTNNPAVAIGVENQKGFLNVGCDADLVVLDKNGFLKQVYKLGKPIQAIDENQPAKLSAVL